MSSKIAVSFILSLTAIGAILFIFGSPNLKFFNDSPMTAKSLENDCEINKIDELNQFISDGADVLELKAEDFKNYYANNKIALIHEFLNYVADVLESQAEDSESFENNDYAALDKFISDLLNDLELKEPSETRNSPEKELPLENKNDVQNKYNDFYGKEEIDSEKLTIDKHKAIYEVLDTTHAENITTKLFEYSLTDKFNELVYKWINGEIEPENELDNYVLKQFLCKALRIWKEEHSLESSKSQVNKSTIENINNLWKEYSETLGQKEINRDGHIKKAKKDAIDNFIITSYGKKVEFKKSLSADMFDELIYNWLSGKVEDAEDNDVLNEFLYNVLKVWKMQYSSKLRNSQK